MKNYFRDISAIVRALGFLVLALVFLLLALVIRISMMRRSRN